MRLYAQGLARKKRGVLLTRIRTSGIVPGEDDDA